MLFKNVLSVIMIVVLFAVIGCENKSSTGPDNKMPVDGQIFVFDNKPVSHRPSSASVVYFENNKFILGSGWNHWKIIQSQYDSNNHSVVLNIETIMGTDTLRKTYTAYEAIGITRKDFSVPSRYSSYDDYSGLFTTSYQSIGSPIDSIHIIAINQSLGKIKILKLSSLLIEEPIIDVSSNQYIPGSTKVSFSLNNGEAWELSRSSFTPMYTPQRSGVVDLKRTQQIWGQLIALH